MKKLSFFIVMILLNSSLMLAQVGINTNGSNPDPSAGLDVKFSNKGFLPPRMSRAELNVIPNPADGLIVYCTNCGANGAGALTMFMSGAWYSLSANCLIPISPVTGTHVASPTQIVWNWNAALNASGYKWSTTNVFANATDMGLNLQLVETGLTCNTNYSRYVWAYSECGNSTVTTLVQATQSTTINAPTSGAHVSSPTQIVWNWNSVSGATGYKWSLTNNYSTATDMGASLTKTETGLTCLTPYTRFV